MIVRFPPVLDVNGKTFLTKNCFLINENNSEIPSKGPCYDSDNWHGELKKNADSLMNLQDILARKVAKDANGKWGKFSKNNPKKARAIRNSYILATHGSRSAYIALHAAHGRAHIIPIRNVSTRASSLLSRQEMRMKILIIPCSRKMTYGQI